MHEPLIARSLDDAGLARAIAAAGAQIDGQAEAELCRRYARRVRLYGLRHLRDAHAAADLVQQVLMMVLERLRAGKLRDPDKLASFVLGTCRMVVLDLRRGNARRGALLETYGVVEEAVEANEPRALDAQRLSVCLQGLAERERGVLLLCFFADKSADETASALALTPGNVRVIRHRALAKLRDCMDGPGAAS